MNDNIGEQEVYGSNMSSSQINEPVLSINDMGKNKIWFTRCSMKLATLRGRGWNVHQDSRL